MGCKTVPKKFKENRWQSQPAVHTGRSQTGGMGEGEITWGAKYWRL
jgi:hypothetical protein